MGIRVIINADDLGKNSVVNEAIGRSLSDGVISSSTIMANNDVWEEVHHIVNQNPQASFGVHLNLTEGRALTDNPILFQSGIVDENNCFTKRVRHLSSYTPEIMQAVRNEWLLQLKKVIKIEGINVTHVDGHHHIHTFYPFYDILIDCLKCFGISKIRNRYIFPRNFSSSTAHSLIGKLNTSDTALRLLDGLKRKHAYFNVFYDIIEKDRWHRQIIQDLTTTTYFDSYAHFCQNVKFLGKNDTTVELMCHPGHPAFQAEFDSIKNHQLEKFISFKLISYKEL